jgi:hypothetical protein
MDQSIPAAVPDDSINEEYEEDFERGSQSGENLSFKQTKPKPQQKSQPNTFIP